jgi:hypothetical protein
VTLRLIFDETVLAGYANMRDVAIGELLKMVEEDGGRSLVGVPAACFITAFAELHDGSARDRLIDFVTDINGVVAILPLLGADTVEVALTGAHAIIETERHAALLVTYQGAAARKRLSEDRILELDP